MAGLLDFYDDPEQAARLAFGAGLLSAGGPQLRPVSVGQALASGLLASQQAGTEAAWNKRRGALTDMTIQEHQARMQAQQQAQAEALRKQEYLRSYLSQGVPSMAFNPGADPKMQNAPRLDPMALAAAGFSPDEVTKIVSLPNAGRPEAKHWANTRDPNGGVSVTGFNQYGDPIKTGQTPYVAPEFRDLGGQQMAIDPVTMKPLGQWGKTMTPGERDSSARGWAGLALQRENATRETAKDRADARKAAEVEKKDAMRRDMQSQRADIVIQTIDQALGQTGKTTTGALGAALGVIPGTGAYDLRRTVDTIKANVGFQELQAMREASPTGGALGQVAVQELNMLQAVIASLDGNQSEAQMRQGLEKARKHFENWKGAVSQAKDGQGGATGQWGGGWSIQKVE